MIPNFCRNQANLTGADQLLYDIGKYIDQYVGLGVSILGISFNTFSMILMLNVKFKHNFYDFLRCRCFTNLVVCLCALVYAIFGGLKVCRTSYIEMSVAFYVALLPLRLAFLASVICDNFLLLNRLVNLYKIKNSIFSNLSKKVIQKLIYKLNRIIFY